MRQNHVYPLGIVPIHIASTIICDDSLNGLTPTELIISCTRQSIRKRFGRQYVERRSLRTERLSLKNSVNTTYSRNTMIFVLYHRYAHVFICFRWTMSYTRSPSSVLVNCVYRSLWYWARKILNRFLLVLSNFHFPDELIYLAP